MKPMRFTGRAGVRTVVVLVALVALAALGGCGGGSSGGGRESAALSRTSSLAIHGCYGDDTSASGFANMVAAGCNVIDRAAFRVYLDRLPPGIKGMVWLGGYDNRTCTWKKSDDWIRSHVRDIAGHPAIAFYVLHDTPHAWDCPEVPAQTKARSDLVHSLDPGSTTFTVLEPHPGDNPYRPYVGTVDLISVDRYPCTFKDGCVMSRIEDTARLLDDAQVPRYVAILQAFGDSTHRLPTADELREQFVRWGNTRAEGIMTFSWNFGTAQLDDHPDLVAVISSENNP